MKGIVIWIFVVCVAVGRAQVDQCPQEQETNWEIEMLLRHDDCHKFYKCTFGVPIEMQCPSDLYFNLETWQCDWKQNVDCTDRNIPDEDTTTSTTTTTTAAPTTTTSTTTSTTTTTTPAPTTTTTTTTTPAPTTTTSTTTTTTPAPTTTSTTTTTTPAPTTTSTTTTTSAPTTTASTTTTTTTESTEIDFLPNGCPVDPHIHWLLPHEDDCNAFYYCVWGQLVLRQCPSTLHFNRVIQVCDWPWDAGCPVSLNKHLNFRR